MRTIGSIERFLVVGIVLVIGAILTVAIKGAGDFEEREGALVGGVPKPVDPKAANAKSGAKPADPRGGRKTEPKVAKSTPPAENGNGASLRREGPLGSLKAQPPQGVGSLSLPTDLPAPTDAPGPSGGPVANGNGAAPPEKNVANPLIDDLLRRRRDAALAEMNAQKSDAPAPSPVVVEDDPKVVKGGATADLEPPIKVREYQYEVRSGDSLERVARSLYGDGALWQTILDANPALTDKNKLRVGMRLKLPKAPTQGTDLVSTIESAATEGAKLAVSGSEPLVPVKALELTPSAKEKTAATAPATPKRVTSSSEHTVAKGDTLMSIALANYGTKSAWKLVFDANSDRITDKDRLKVGTVLRLPSN